MATIVLSAAGAALGSSLGGSVLGLSTAVIGRAVGATLGRVIDQRLMGSGSQVVEQGKVERFRLMGASEGAPVQQLWGRLRVSGQVVWATRFQERVTVSGGSGKGAPTPPKTRTYSYGISLAIALCEGEIARVGRIWADGAEVEPASLNFRVYRGTEDQLPDAKIAAVEGAGRAPAYRGIAYVVFEDLDLSRFGNRVPQFSFEVIRPARAPSGAAGLADVIRGVALVPGTGEYALATTPVHFEDSPGVNRTANAHTPGAATDLAASLSQLEGELPECGSVLLVASWFGDDLRCGTCAIRPKVEQQQVDGVGMPWSVSGLTRATAETVPWLEGRPVYGGTPTDRSVIEAIAALREAGKSTVFYPFVLMEQVAGNGRPDPWSGEPDQPVLPWRGRITTSVAPGRAGSPDGTAAAEAEVSAFFGTAQPGDFAVGSEGVGYTGASDWGFRRMILHYAHLCAAAGGVDAFCIGSEMRSLTQIRGAGGSFPAVSALRDLARDVRHILGPDTKIGYAADWSEYFGYHPQDGSGDVYFHLDPLWSDPYIDFIGIDNYMPLSDWREGDDHADAEWGSIYALDYLKANVAGGEGYDWYYASEEERRAQLREPITDGAHGEPWVFRYKDLRNWWERPHHERIGGVRSTVPTAWVPQSKPFWFTEFGCAAIDKGTNEPNKFLDRKSSESSRPRFSKGTRDDLIQAQYYLAVTSHWSDPGNNPVSEVFGGTMVDLSRAHAWAWDARPYPVFPSLAEIWSDGENYIRGHWLNGRVSSQSLAAVVAEICARSGMPDADVSDLYGLVRGYSVSDVDSARSALQPLMLAYGFEAVERAGTLGFRNRSLAKTTRLSMDVLALMAEQETALEFARSPAAETAGRVRLTHVEADGDFAARASEAVSADEATYAISQSELPLVLTAAEGRAIVERWLSEARVARDTVRFSLPPSALTVGAGDLVDLGDAGGALYRVDRVEQAGAILIEAVRTERHLQTPSEAIEEYPGLQPYSPALPVHALFLDLPLLTGNEVPHAPHVAASSDPWPGGVALYSSMSGDQGYELNSVLEQSAVIGTTLSALPAGRSGLWQRGVEMRVRISGGVLVSAGETAVLAGANVAAIGSGAAEGWELIQFRDAKLIGLDEYELSGLLRGQLGTEADMAEVWPPGSAFVLLSPAIKQINLQLSARRLARDYRIGPATRPYDDISYIHRVEAFSGIGLRPYAPAHLVAAPIDSGALLFSWVRRTRIGGDSWEGEEVPLGEDFEAYRVRVLVGEEVRRELTVTSPSWTYTSSDQVSDGVTGPISIEVAQLSATFGPGPFKRIDTHV